MKNLKSVLFLIIFTVTIKGYFFSQTLAMDVIGSNGGSIIFPDGSMAWTIGEVTIDTYASAENFLTQGFHQPSNKDGVIPVITDFNIPEGYSPNGDGTNDLFVIRGVNKYPKNSIEIFNRWGDKVYEASPYINLWDGTTKMGISVGGDNLPVGTYFYVFDFGNGSKPVKGTIYLNM
ncbi:MAG: gliding motility-associated C-terminal domain-containing protein [Bacteroidota bacterium]